jgi:hypothetical protein
MEDNEMPEENNIDHLEFGGPTPLEQDAAQMHEMFKALLSVGFTERQSLQLVAFLMSESMEDGPINLFFDETFLREMRKEDDEEDEEDDGQDS